jgi:hypothetical protein
MRVTAEKQAYWEKHLADWKCSGLTQKDYCKREKLAYGSFKSWRSQLLESRHVQTPNFIEATPEEPEKSSSNALILQISLANGSRIGVNAQTSVEIVKHVLALTGRAS